MSQETHGHEQETEKKSKTSLRSSFWFVVIVVGLFIAALNFIKSENSGEEKHESPATTEATTHEAATPAAVADTTKHEAAPAEEAHH